VLDHRRQGVHPGGHSAYESDTADLVDDSQERRQPGFDDQEVPVPPQNPHDFTDDLIQVLRQVGEVMQTAMGDEDVVAA